MGPRICIPNKSPGDAETVNLGTTVLESLLQAISQMRSPRPQEVKGHTSRSVSGPGLAPSPVLYLSTTAHGLTPGFSEPG